MLQLLGWLCSSDVEGTGSPENPLEVSTVALIHNLLLYLKDRTSAPLETVPIKGKILVTLIPLC
jgi:hypothetical protein